MSIYYTYILRCADDTLYTGITTDLDRRTDEHNGLNNDKKGAKYTASRRPVTLVYSQEFTNRSEAMKEEARIKKLNKNEKEFLISKNQRAVL
ncbi:GIY-YIG nuclease family protein [Candidatus Nomurabacteria bacterium]|nr:GIY-YIG nuclease family protein [Candidatus Nomurabacteria bacterium]